MSDGHASPAGAEWHRWEPHIHAPGTLLSDHFGNDWDAYLARLESAVPSIEALAITDYYCIQTYKRVVEAQMNGRLPTVKLLFPNVEMRLTIETEKRKGINLHLLFSPSPDHVTQIERLLGLLTFEYKKSRYACRLEELARLGRAYDPAQTDEQGAVQTGANQFKVSLEQLRDLFRTEKWLRENCLVGVAGAEQDGTAGLQADASFAATRDEIERFANIIFSGQPSTRDFWLGRKAGFDRASIQARYGYLKPCLHGSDAHRIEDIGAPKQGRLCWIKADLTFEGLRQAVIEPAERVHVGPLPPEETGAFNRIRSIALTGAPWFKQGQLPLNQGLVAIIGARGSGKTALADILACGANALGSDSDASFVHRATTPTNLLKGASVQQVWSDGTEIEKTLREPDPLFDEDSPPRVKYLSQQFVERLCSKDGLGAELVKEIEAVVFAATDDIDRLGTVSFAELRNARLEPIQRERQLHTQAEGDASKQIAEEDALTAGLDAEKRKLNELIARIGAAAKELESLVPKGHEERAKRLAELEDACRLAESDIQSLRLQKQKLEELAAEVERIRTRDEPQRMSAMQRRYEGARLTPQEWAPFGMAFVGDAGAILKNALTRVEAKVERRMRVDLGQPVPPKLEATSPLPLLRSAREEAKSAVGVDTQKAKRFGELKAQIATWEGERKALEGRIAFISGSAERRKVQVDIRRDAYLGVFGTFAKEQKILEELYEPLVKRLEHADASAKLEFAVMRRVDVDTWVRRGEDLLDLRTAGAFRGRGSLKRAVEQELLPAWRTGTPADVGAARAAFVEKYRKDILAGSPVQATAGTERSKWLRNVSTWLFSADHISLQYSLRFDGIDVQQLSPGTRGIVLLTLYLEIDEWDRRPLVVDQPEENLDPKSVFAELVAFFRNARSRRQVILVTHNANLVVNTDADQVIVASATRTKPEGLPDISYLSGALENKMIRDAVCELLEGGEEAFKERERRYRLRWTDADAGH